MKNIITWYKNDYKQTAVVFAIPRQDMRHLVKRQSTVLVRASGGRVDFISLNRSPVYDARGDGKHNCDTDAKKAEEETAYNPISEPFVRLFL